MGRARVTQPTTRNSAEPVDRTNVEPEHPFRNARDANYVPPLNRNVGAPIKVPHTVARRPDAAYQNKPPVHDPKIAVDVYQRAMGAPVTVTCQELLSIAPEVRAQVREAITAKRLPNKDVAPVALLQDSAITAEDLSYVLPGEVLPFSNCDDFDSSSSSTSEIGRAHV